MVLRIICKPDKKIINRVRGVSDAMTNESTNHRAEQRPDMKTLILAHIWRKDEKEIDDR